jgi:hypothetical protein
MQLAGFFDYIISEDSDLIILKGSKIIIDLKFDKDPANTTFSIYDPPREGVWRDEVQVSASRRF